MENTCIQFRPIAPCDYSALEKIICDTWNYTKICTPKTAKTLSRVYLASCLASQTYTCVALRGGEPVGIIMGKNEKTHRPSMRYVVRQYAAIASMLLRKEGLRVLKTFEGFENINKALFAENTQKFDGELAFFAVRGDQRGTGVGKALFLRLQDYMRSQSISDFYLYTDSTCNYGFYEHQGMRRVCEKNHEIAAFPGKKMSFFLYGMHSPAQ